MLGQCLANGWSMVGQWLANGLPQPILKTSVWGKPSMENIFWEKNDFGETTFLGKPMCGKNRFGKNDLFLCWGHVLGSSNYNIHTYLVQGAFLFPSPWLISLIASQFLFPTFWERPLLPPKLFLFPSPPHTVPPLILAFSTPLRLRSHRPISESQDGDHPPSRGSLPRRVGGLVLSTSSSLLLLLHHPLSLVPALAII